MAPLLAALAAQGFNLIASAVTAKGKDLVEQKLGVNLDAAISTDQGRVQLMQLQYQHEEFLQEHALDNPRLYLSDVQDARKMQTAALAQSDVFSKRFVYYLSSFWSFVAVAYIFAITFIQVNEKATRFADTILGFLLGTVIAMILNFFLGSSTGSKEKDGALAEAIRGARQ